MSNLLKNLILLYGNEANRPYQEIKTLIKEYTRKHPAVKTTSQGCFFSEKDVMLICYPDHVQEPGVKTLATMRKFLNRYARGLINRVHLLPFYECSGFDDGFSVIDYYKVKTRYGDWGDIGRIEKDFDLMFDLILNHASTQSKIFKRQIAGNRKYKDFFMLLDKPIDTGKVFRPRAHPLLTPIKTKTGTKYAWTTFSADQADWNYRNPEVLIKMIKILLFYLSKRAAAVRFDAVAYVWKCLGTDCFDLEECHTIVRIFREIIDQTAPGAWVIAETVLPHARNIDYLGDGKNESHFVYHFALESLLLHTFVSGDSSVATDWLDRLDREFDRHTSILNLSISHDGIHVLPAWEILDDKQMMTVARHCEKNHGQVLYRTLKNTARKLEPYELNITYPSAIGGIEKYLASQAVPLALKGVPLIYFNNLIGAENWLQGVKTTGHPRSINREKFAYNELSAELDNPKSKKHKIYRGYRKLLETRIKEPLFSPVARQKMLKLSNKVIAIKRFNGKKSLLALTNISANRIKINSTELKRHLQTSAPTDIISGQRYELIGTLTLEPYQVLWLK